MHDVHSKEKLLSKGKDLRCCFRPYFFPIKVRLKINEIIPYERVTWSATKKGLSAKHEFIFQDNEAGVIVTSKETFTGILTSASGLLFPRRRLKNLTRTFLIDLKKAAEGSKSDVGQPVLPQGSSLRCFYEKDKDNN